MEDVATIGARMTLPLRPTRAAVIVCPLSAEWPGARPLSVLVPARDLVVADDAGHEEPAVLLDM